ncbi:MAG TPA: response regulator transcription factor [Microvirga sp.]|jgi:DNA-binding NarL/FixJ family response regulator|nr:response regulator transcription factor [Microvirga sp.]
MTSTAKIRILVADDHDDVRSGLRAILGAQPGWEIVAEAADGRQAVELAAETCPDVVVLDYRLPVMNGIDAARAIRAACPGTEVLIFTMHGSRHLIRRLLEAGARGYLAKSEARRFLIAAVTSLARHEPFLPDSVPRDLLDECLGTPAPERE